MLSSTISERDAELKGLREQRDLLMHADTLHTLDGSELLQSVHAENNELQRQIFSLRQDCDSQYEELMQKDEEIHRLQRQVRLGGGAGADEEEAAAPGDDVEEDGAPDATGKSDERVQRKLKRRVCWCHEFRLRGHCCGEWAHLGDSPPM